MAGSSAVRSVRSIQFVGALLLAATAVNEPRKAGKKGDEHQTRSQQDSQSEHIGQGPVFGGGVVAGGWKRGRQNGKLSGGACRLKVAVSVQRVEAVLAVLAA